MFPVAQRVELISPANFPQVISGSKSCFAKTQILVFIVNDVQMNNLLPLPLLVNHCQVPSLQGGAAVSGTAWMVGNGDPMILPALEVGDPLLRETRRVFKEFMER